jgi:heme/copper-type cytochrome/quinol oxidase subunit 3
MTVATTLDRTVTGVATELARGRGGGGPAPKRIVVAYGFWIFILSDMIMFSALFAAYAVLSGNTAGGPTGPQLFNLRNVFIETMCLLLSSYTCGLGALSAERRQPTRFLIFAVLTFILGVAFLFVEITEFARMVEIGAGPSRSAFLSAFFTLVGTFTQIGIHLVFFLHLGSGPDNTNNILALAFGVLIVFLVIIGSVWIIANLNSNMMSNALSGERIITDPGSVTLASWLIAVEGF